MLAGFPDFWEFAKILPVIALGHCPSLGQLQETFSFWVPVHCTITQGLSSLSDSSFLQLAMELTNPLHFQLVHQIHPEDVAVSRLNQAGGREGRKKRSEGKEERKRGKEEVRKRGKCEGAKKEK